MSTKVGKVFLLVIGLSVLITVAVSAAGVAPVMAVDNLFQAINEGQIDQASALFAADAVAHNDVSDILYEGSEEIGRLIENMHRESRVYEIVKLEMSGDTVNFIVEISDRGLVWASQNMTVEVQDGVISNLVVHQIRLQLWRLWD